MRLFRRGLLALALVAAGAAVIWGPSYARGLSLVRPGGKVIPGHGPLASRDDLVAYHAMLVDIRAKVAAGKRAGRSRAQVVAAKPAAAYSGKVQEGFIKADDFVGTVYDMIAAGKR